MRILLFILLSINLISSGFCSEMNISQEELHSKRDKTAKHTSKKTHKKKNSWLSNSQLERLKSNAQPPKQRKIISAEEGHVISIINY